MNPSVEEVETTVNGLLSKVPQYVWDGERLPVPVDEIVSDVYGLYIRLVEDMASAPGCPEVGTETISGLLLTERGEIWVNAWEAAQWEGRRRFTIGHELGHYVMHQESKSRVFCRTDAISEGAEADKPVKPPMEVQADAFAAAMLMPMHLVEAQVAVLGPDVDALCQVFETSNTAMNYRLEAMASHD